MADITKAVEIVFGAVDETTSGINSVVGGLDKLNNSISSATQPLANMFDTVLRIQTGFVALGTAAGVWAVTTAADVSDAFREISTLVDQPLTDLEDFRTEVLKTAATSSSTFADFEGAIYSAISAGIDYTDSVQFTTEAEKLAIAGKAGLNESLVVLVSALNAYGLGADKAGYFSDLLFTTVKQGQTTLPELASSLAQVTAIAANAGVDFENLLAAVASLTSVGFGTAEAVTGLKAVITAILKPTTDQTAAAEKLGLEFNLAALQSKGLAGFMEDVARATGGSEKALIDLFPNVRSMGPALALTGLAAETFKNNLDAMANSAGATDIAYGKMVDSFALGNQRVINSFKGLLIEVGDPLLDEMTNIQQAFVDIFLAITKSFESGSLKAVGDSFEGVAKSISVFLTEFAKNLPAALKLVDFTPALDAIDVFVGAVKGLFGDFDLSSPEGIAEAIQLVVTAFVKFQEVAAAQVENILPLFNKIKLLAGIFLEMDSETSKTVGSILAFGKEVNVITGLLSPLFDILGSVFGILSQIVLLNIAAKFGLIPPAVAGATSAFTGFLGLLAGPVGLVALAAGAGASVGTMANALLEYNGISIGSSLYDLKEWLSDILNPTEVAARNFATLEERQLAAARAAAELADAGTQAVLQGGNWAESLAEINKEYEAYGLSIRKAIDNTTISVEQFNALKFASAELGTEVTDVGKAMEIYTKHLEEVNAASEEATKKAEEKLRQDNQLVDIINARNAALIEEGAAYRYLANGTQVSIEAFERLGGVSQEVIRDLTGMGLTAEQTTRANELYGDSWELVNGVVQRVVPGIGRAVEEVDYGTAQWVKTVGEDGTVVWEQLGRKAPPEIKKVEDAMTEAAKKTLEFQIAMEEIASNERIKLIEAKVELNIAELQANADIVKATLETIASVVEDTIGGISALFGMTENPEWDRFGFEARAQLKKYNEMLEEQMRMQRDLTNAQIGYMNARTAALASGEALITVNGDGLQPHLEAFMFELLKAVQVRASQEGSNFLLGIE